LKESNNDVCLADVFLGCGDWANWRSTVYRSQWSHSARVKCANIWTEILDVQCSNSPLSGPRNLQPHLAVHAATLHESRILRPHRVGAEESSHKTKLLINHHQFNLGVNIRDALKIYRNLVHVKDKAIPVTARGGP
jgi:hypothetical protein